MSRKKAGDVPVLKKDAAVGLTSGEAEARELAGLCNLPVKPPSKTVGQIIFTNVFTYFNMFFFALAVCIALVGSWLDMAFMGVVIANSFIGIVQELRSKKKLDKLTILSAPRGVAVRDGAEVTLETSRLVRDDVVVLGVGEQIYADAEVLDGSCRVNEALVTGEADEIEKAAGDTLLSGSFVVSGSCRARLTAVGAESFASRLTVEARRGGRVKRSEMMRSLSRLVAVIGAVAIPFGAAILYKEMSVLGRELRPAVVSTTAALVGMIPEGLYLLTSLALVAGVIRLSGRGTLVHEMACIETLARVDVLCVDKTGTITEPEMTVDGVVALDGRTEAESAALLADYCASFPPENDTMRALLSYFGSGSGREAAATLPFTSSKKYGGVRFRDGGAFLLGAPEVISGGELPELEARASDCARGGRRVLLLAEYDGELGETITGRVTPVCLVTLQNSIRAEAPETFRWFAEQGVSVRVISGDSPATVSEIAAAAGIEGASRAVDARTLITDEDISSAAEKYVVFGRVTPEQKRKLVRAMKSAGHIVAMTGDGVNDVLALREADCSVAMASGSAAAGQVADIVLLGSDFSAMPSVTAEGRRIINNIERSASLYIVKNIFSFALALITLIFTMPYPFSPSQLTLVNMMTIGIPSFVLAMEPNHERVRGRFMRNVISRALPAAMSDLALVLAALYIYSAFRPDMEAVSTVTTLIMGCVGLGVIDKVCRPYNGNAIRIALTVSMTALFFTGFCLMTALVTRPALSAADYVILAAFALAAVPVLWLFTAAFERVSRAVSPSTSAPGKKR